MTSTSKAQGLAVGGAWYWNTGRDAVLMSAALIAFTWRSESALAGGPPGYGAASSAATAISASAGAGSTTGSGGIVGSSPSDS